MGESGARMRCDGEEEEEVTAQVPWASDLRGIGRVVSGAGR